MDSHAQDREESNRAAYIHNYPDHKTAIEKDQYDVIIIGAGPAGLMLATALARFGSHSILIVDCTDEPTTAGRADGLQPRTIEILKNLEPLGSELYRQSAASFERTFWVPGVDDEGKATIVRDRRVQSFPDDLEIEDGCTLGLQQGMIEEAFLRDMDRNGLSVTRPFSFHSYQIDSSSSSPYPVTVQLTQGAVPEAVGQAGPLSTVRCKYLVGCDGGRSAVRRYAMKHDGVTFDGELLGALWGAGDFVVKTDFPDIRKIAAIHSASQGSAYVFPRENNVDNEPMIRLYTQINMLDGQKNAMDPQEMRWKVTAQDIMDADRRIFAPYHLEFVKTEWWSAYPIGQRLVNKYDVGGRVFMAGDACHTHSPKAGQGMNTAIVDAHNLSFKLHLVLRGLAGPELLNTYHEERWKIGKQLIDFDEEYAALFSGEVPKNTPEVATMTPDEVKAHFVAVQRKNAGFTTGVGVHYGKSPMTVMNEDLGEYGLKPIEGLKIRSGQRLLPATVTRSMTSEPVRLIHEVQFDAPGGFRIYVLAGDLKKNRAKLEKLSGYLTSESSFISRYTAALPKNRKVLAPATNTGLVGYEELNPYFSILTIVNSSRFGFEVEELKPLKGLSAMIYADDRERAGVKVGETPSEAHVGGTHIKYGLPDGGIIVCRPDGYVGIVVPLEEEGWKSLDRYFDAALYRK